MHSPYAELPQVPTRQDRFLACDVPGDAGHNYYVAWYSIQKYAFLALKGIDPHAGIAKPPAPLKGATQVITEAIPQSHVQRYYRWQRQMAQRVAAEDLLQAHAAEFNAWLRVSA